MQNCYKYAKGKCRINHLENYANHDDRDTALKIFANKLIVSESEKHYIRMKRTLKQVEEGMPIKEVFKEEAEYEYMKEFVDKTDLCIKQNKGENIGVSIT